jgi:NADH dehydrogenase
MQKDLNKSRRIYIIGGGFAGIRAGLDLVKGLPSNVEVNLVSNKNHFEYYPRIYKVVTGANPREVCIPLAEIFFKKRIKVICDEIKKVDLKSKNITGKDGTVYEYDDLILALGSETVYFNIEGVKERSFGFKSIREALALKKHLHKMFDVYLSAQKEDVISQLHLIIVGGGPSGVELTGKLVTYMKELAKHHSVKNEFITIDLVEAASALVPTLPGEVSNHIYNRLHGLGVNIFLNRSLIKEDIDEILMKDMSMRSNTLIWTAGSRTNHFYESISGITLHRNGRVLVDEYLRPEGFENVYIAGDSAHTPYAGLAQTALYDGSFIAKTIKADIKGNKMSKYVPEKVAYAVPVGDCWAAVSWGPLKFYGWFGYVLRELIDLRFFMSILPFHKAFRIFQNTPLRESCHTCQEDMN